MQLQQRVLEDYKQVFPKDTLKIISNRTNIQMTRVFRIFNGAEMKLKEFESLQSLISTKSSYTDLSQLMNQCITHLTFAQLEDIHSQLKYKLKLKNLNQKKSIIRPMIKGEVA